MGRMTNASHRQYSKRTRLQLWWTMALWSLLLLLVTIESGDKGGALGFQVYINNFTDSFNNLDWSVSVERGSFIPYVDSSGVFQLSSTSTTQTLTYITYVRDTYQGGNTPFRLDVEFANRGILTARFDVSWLDVEFWDGPMIYLNDNLGQFLGFYLNETQDDAYHHYTIEFHPSTMQVFVYVDGGDPKAQITMTRLPRLEASITFKAFIGDSSPIPIALKSFWFNSDSFVPSSTSTVAAFARPPLPIKTQLSTKDFVTGWSNSPRVDIKSDNTIVHNLFPVGASWLLNPVWIPSVLHVSFIFQFENGYPDPYKYGLMFVIQSKGANIIGITGWGFGFSSWPGFGIAFSPELTTGAIYLYDNIARPTDPSQLPPYNGYSCGALMGTYIDFNVSMDIDLYGGSVFGTIRNANGDSCIFNFYFDPSPALEAIDLNTRLGYIGFTSSTWDNSGRLNHLYAFQFHSDAPSVSTTPSTSIASSISLTPTVSPLDSITTKTTTIPQITPNTTTNPTKNPTANPTVISVSSDDVIINKVCSDPGDYQCPSKACVKDPSNCGGGSGSSTNQQVRSIETTIPDNSKGKPVTINIVSTSDSVIASVKFPADTLEPGWVISVAPSPLQDRNDSQVEGECGSVNDAELVTAPFQITVRDQRGRPVTEFSNPFVLSSFATFKNSKSLDKSCFGYVKEHEGDDIWRCVTKKDTKTKYTRRKNLYFLQSSVDHFTTFAVLLGGDDLKDGSCNDFGWVEISSLSVLGAAIVISAAVVVLYYVNPAFRSWAQGFDPKMKVSALIAKANVPTDIHSAH
eukprot:TRINITY_DN1749_c0_g1_i1.p1 TRINITY_DN1749_c0_g1~~TRINITY_DN1749_c0_g1_i1.p1  ORF type:complete len:799 (+),score=108.96 TRINITY_DN1749_c0_g1_i1:227-2623(+)